MSIGKLEKQRIFNSIQVTPYPNPPLRSKPLFKGDCCSRLLLGSHIWFVEDASFSGRCSFSNHRISITSTPLLYSSITVYYPRLVME